MAQVENLQASSDARTEGTALTGVPRIYFWLLGFGLVVIVMLACLLWFGPNMEYPTDCFPLRSRDHRWQHHSDRKVL